MAASLIEIYKNYESPLIYIGQWTDQLLDNAKIDPDVFVADGSDKSIEAALSTPKHTLICINADFKESRHRKEEVQNELYELLLKNQRRAVILGYRNLSDR